MQGHFNCKKLSPLYPVQHIVRCFVLLLATFDVASAYAPSPRWGQASTTVSNKLLVHGGKVDSNNQYSYTSAPNTNNLLSLDLSSSFPLSDPPWALLSGSDLPSSSQGPAVSFHTITALSNEQILSFGGDGGPPMAIETYADSAWLVSNISSTSGPTWVEEPKDWASEPMRRIYHAATALNGAVWISGGMKADGSGLGFREVYRYTPGAPPSTPDSFSLLSPNLPDFVGHASIVLANGTLVLFGGWSPSQNTMLPLSQMWLINTTSVNPLTWTLVTLSGTVPSPRRNFAYALLDGGKIIIHGGGDSALQNINSDGAILDLETMSWSSVNGMGGTLGPRYDHLAVGLGSQVLIAFGYGSNGPASANLTIYDTSSGTFLSTYNPLPSSTLTNIPGQPSPTSQTDGSKPTRTVGHGVTTTDSHGHTIVTTPPSDPSQTVGSPTDSNTGGPSPTGGGNGDAPDKSGSNSRIIGIALGTTFGAIALVVVGASAAYYVMKHRRATQWGADEGSGRLIWANTLYDDDDNDDADGSGVANGSRTSHWGEKVLPVTMAGWPPVRRKSSAWVMLGRNPRPGESPERQRQRFDMLADEDEREFGDLGVYTGAGVSRDTSAGSGSSAPVYRRTASGRSWTEVVNEGVSSIRSAIGRSVSGSGARGRTSPEWLEKNPEFLDDQARLLDEQPTTTPAGTAVPTILATRMRGGEPTPDHSRDSSYYRDPFEENVYPPTSSLRAVSHDRVGSDPFRDTPAQGIAGSSTGPGTALHSISMPIPEVVPLFPVATKSDDAHATSDLSRPVSSSDSSSGRTGLGATSRSRSSSGTNATILSSAPSAPLRRSDSWWARFKGTSLLGETSPISPTNSMRRMSFRLPTLLSSSDPRYSLEFRDPNPPPPQPILHAIQESGNTPDGSPDSPENARQNSLDSNGASKGKKPRLEGYGNHARSTSSLQTASSDMLERLGGNMHVVQRVQTGSTTRTASASDSLSSSHRVAFGSVDNSETGALTVSPTDIASDQRNSVLVGPRAPPPPPPNSKLKTPLPEISARIAEYERRVSLGPDGLSSDRLHGGPRLPPAPIETAAERRERRHPRATSISMPGVVPPVNVRYGLAERPSLFIANPDSRRQTSGDTETSTG